MRETTERPEVVEARCRPARGETSVDAIVEQVATLLTDRDAYAACQIDHNPCGDGRAAERIVDWMTQRFSDSSGF